MALHIHLRSLLRSKVFLATAVALLGLGLGVNVILFNTVYALLWRPLHFPSPDRLVALCGKSASGDLAQSITGADAAILREQTGVVAATGMATSGRLVTLWKDNDSLDLSATAVNSGYFEALGLRPLAGRFFGAEEDQGSNSEQHIVLTEPA
ncbi:MAG TPA: ABC transporter permease, partial [Candidatus Sulfopaludibacter sp.]|nr:ABC transporter permease [Candidatus Sulfopaludibacter sp.]